MARVAARVARHLVAEAALRVGEHVAMLAGSKYFDRRGRRRACSDGRARVAFRTKGGGGSDDCPINQLFAEPLRSSLRLSV